MRIDVQYRPAYALAVVHLAPGETVVAEGGSMITMDSNVSIETSAAKPGQGLVAGLLGGLKRMIAGESFFQNRYVAQNGSATVSFAPTHVGDIAVHDLSTTGLVLQSKAYLCSAPSVEIDAKWAGGRGFFSGEGLIMLKASGRGPLAFNAFGGIKEVQVDGGLVVDTGHVVAFEDTLTYRISRFGSGIWSFLAGGEGLTCAFSGKGRVWIQTRNPQAFGQAIGPKLPMRSA